MSKIKILYVAADSPSASPGETVFQREKEVRQIRAMVIAAGRDGLEFSAASTGDLFHALQTRLFQVVHFSGHGGNAGLVLSSDWGNSRLAEVLGEFSDDIRLVVLDACFSQSLATVIADVVGSVVGTSASISDEGALAFNSTFYRALAFGQPISTAFDLARTTLALEHLDEEAHPTMVVRAGVDPSQMILIRPGGANAPDRGFASREEDDDLLLVADLDATPVELTVELMGALDELHRALGGGGLEIRSAHAGSAATVGMPV